MSTAPFTTVMEPLWRFYGDPRTVSVRMTAPGRVIVSQQNSGPETFDVPELTVERLTEICATLAAATNHHFDLDAAPCVRCIIPGTNWFANIVVGPAVQSGVSLAINSRFRVEFSWDGSTDHECRGNMPDKDDGNDDGGDQEEQPERAGHHHPAHEESHGDHNPAQRDLAEGGTGYVYEFRGKKLHWGEPAAIDVWCCIIVATSWPQTKFVVTFFMTLSIAVLLSGLALSLDRMVQRLRHTARRSDIVDGLFFEPVTLMTLLNEQRFLITVIGAVIALLPEGTLGGVSESPAGVMASLAGLLCGYDLILVWLRACLRPREGVR